MDQLIKTVNKLQDAFAAVGVSSPVDLPQIVVIGSQSSGKSSVLENIVGKDFLPRGTGIVTRRPLVLQLINVPSNSESGEAEQEEYGEFLHLPGQKFTKFNEIREEIIRDTEAKTGKNAGISPNPINLRIFSPKVLTLTLVDLPGLTKVPVGDQPKDIEAQIRDMIMKYISKPNAIILAVTGANTDLANSDGLKLAREVDPEGIRTLGVLTKVDLMDQGTDVVDILSGKIIPLRLGYIPVVNRGQKDIERNKSIVSALDAEKKFFETHPSYATKSQYCGTPFLARKLNAVLMHHIKSTLPEIKAKISSGLSNYENELLQLGDPVDQNTSSGLILSIITEFCNDFRTVLEGNSNDLPSMELSGGARISFVLHEIFGNAIKSFDPFDTVKDVDIRTIMYNSSGSAPSLFVGTTAFEVIVKQQIKRLEEPSLKCITMIYDELARILGQLLQKSTFRRFPNLRDKFYNVVVNFFKKAIIPTNKLVSDLISAESCYINTAHPDFITGHRAMAIVGERLNPKPLPSIDSNSRNGSKTTNTNPVSTANLFDMPKKEEDGFFSSFWTGSKKSKKPGQLEPPPPVLKASGNLSDREIMETEVIKLLIQSYYSIVKRTVSDLVPKAIMLNLVFYSKENLQRELLQELYSKREQIEESVKESEFVQQRRQECKKMIAALQKADEITMSNSIKTKWNSSSTITASANSSKTLKDPLRVYRAKIATILLSEDLNLLAALCQSSLVGDTAVAFANTIIRLLKLMKQDTSIQFLKRVLKVKISLYLSKGRKVVDLLRDNSLSTTMVVAYSKSIGLPMLKSTLSEPIKAIVKQMKEYQEPRDNDGNDPNLSLDGAMMLLKAIIASKDNLPRQFRQICRLVKLQVENAMLSGVNTIDSIVSSGQGPSAANLSRSSTEPSVADTSTSKRSLIMGIDESHRNMSSRSLGNITEAGSEVTGDDRLTVDERIVGSLVFLRFFVPAITAPENYGLLDSQLSGDLRKHLINIGKILNGFCSEATIKDKDNRVVDFISDYRNEVCIFLADITNDASLDDEFSQKLNESVTLKHILEEDADNLLKEAQKGNLLDEFELDDNLVSYLHKSVNRIEKDLSLFVKSVGGKESEGVLDSFKSLKKKLESYNQVAIQQTKPTSLFSKIGKRFGTMKNTYSTSSMKNAKSVSSDDLTILHNKKENRAEVKLEESSSLRQEGGGMKIEGSKKISKSLQSTLT